MIYTILAFCDISGTGLVVPVGDMSATGLLVLYAQ